jgi:hypothetical protein
VFFALDHVGGKPVLEEMSHAVMAAIQSLCMAGSLPP